MLYQNLLASDDKRFGRKIIEAEKEIAYVGWEKAMERIAWTIEMDIGNAQTTIKNTREKEVKVKIKIALEKHSKRNEENCKSKVSKGPKL